MRNFLSPPTAKERIAEDKIKSEYRSRRFQVFCGIFFGYAAFYLVRKNFSLAFHDLETELGISKDLLGFAFSFNAIAYGFSKFIMGGVSDRSNARRFLPLGLILTSLAMILAGSAFGLYNVATMAVCQFLIGWLGGMGWPPCGRVMTHWFSQKERGTKMAFWNLAHNIGGAALGPITTFAFSFFLAANYSKLLSIQLGFFVIPSLIAILIALISYLLIRDNPQSCGLPSIEEYRDDFPTNYSEEHEKVAPLKEIFFKYIFRNKVLWFVALANVFVYLVRYGVLDWAPTYLQQVKGYDIKEVGWAYAYYELAAIPGTLLCGWISDRVFRGRRALPNMLFMALVAVCIFVYWQNGQNPALGRFLGMFSSNVQLIDNIALTAIGFFIYGPIMLIGVQALDLAPKNASGASAGFTGLFGYVFGTAILGNTLLGYLAAADSTWNSYFVVLMAACALSVFFMILTIKAENKLKKT